MASSIKTKYGETVPYDDLIHSRAKALKVLIKRVETEIKSCKKFYIGKSSIKEKEEKKDFDIKNDKTWNYDNIEGRETDNEKKHGTSTFVILAAIDEKPSIALGSVEQYALSLEAGLIFHFMYDKPNKRLINESHHPGGSAEAPGYVVYIAYDDDDSSTSSSSSSSSD